MPKRFGKIILASTGDHPRNKDDKIKGWVEHAGGTFVNLPSKDKDKDGLALGLAHVLKNITHLVCSAKAWKAYYPVVKEARRKRTIEIIKLDWLEDSLLSKSGKPLDTAKYQWEQRKVIKYGVTKRKRAVQDESGDEDGEGTQPKKAKQNKASNSNDDQLSKDKRIAKAGKEFDQACEEFETLMGQKGYRPFTDQSGFVYLITLLRKDILKNRLEKHRIKVRHAPHFSAQPSTFIPATRPWADPQLATSDRSLSSSDPVLEHSGSDARAFEALHSDESVLPPCPVPMYYFPKPHPYSHNIVVSCSLPRHLTFANPNLRVRIPDPWAQSLQLFVSERTTSVPVTDNTKCTTANVIHSNISELRTKTYAAYTVYTKPGIRHVETIVPHGSNFDFAWAMFTRFFQKKTGTDWTDLHGGWRGGQKFEDMLRARFGGEDGASDSRRWDVLEPPVAMERIGEKADGSGVARERAPSITILRNTNNELNALDVDAKAMTPEHGW